MLGIHWASAFTDELRTLLLDKTVSGRRNVASIDIRRDRPITAAASISFFCLCSMHKPQKQINKNVSLNNHSTRKSAKKSVKRNMWNNINNPVIATQALTSFSYFATAFFYNNSTLTALSDTLQGVVAHPLLASVAITARSLFSLAGPNMGSLRKMKVETQASNGINTSKITASAIHPEKR